VQKEKIHYVVYDIFGLRQLKNDIDIYLKSLIDDFKFYEKTTDEFDAYYEKNFMLCYTIDDFLAYDNLKLYIVRINI